jgi:protein-disulfide isomerase
VFLDLPLAMHADAPKAAEAALCAHDQGKFWEYHDKLFENQRALKVPNLKQYAADMQLDTTAFATCLDSGQFGPSVQADMQKAASLGVTGTPAFFVNGRFINGAQPFEKFAQIIDEELARQ